MLHHPAFRTIFKPQMPVMKVLDVQSSTADLTTYTFANMSLGDQGADGDQGSLGTNPHIRSPSHKLYFVIVHAEAALATWTVSSVTFGGVGISSRVDGGGVTTVSTAIFSMPAENLRAATTNDIVVVFSKAVTAAAVAIISVENIGTQTNISAPITSGTGALAMDPSTSTFSLETFGYLLAGTTCSVGTENVDFQPSTQGGVSPVLLYEGSNAEIAFAAAWNYSPQDNADNNNSLGMIINWNGAGTGDAAGVVFA